MRTFLKVIAWIGLGFMAIGVAISFYTWISIINYVPERYPTMGPGFGWILIIPLDILGLLLMTIGGMIARPKYLWLAIISTGLLHILISAPQLPHLVQMQGRGLLSITFNSLVSPGVLAILLGILLLTLNIILTKRKQKEV